MPNWAYTNVTVKGTKKEIHNFIKLGLVNSGVNESEIPAELRKAFDVLLEKGRHKGAVTTGTNWQDSKVVGVELKDGVMMSTFLPIPDSYFLYDTTNSPNSAPESVLAEQESYGAIGWYDYNRKYFGTKWDVELENLNLNEYADKDMAMVTFRTEPLGLCLMCSSQG